MPAVRPAWFRDYVKPAPFADIPEEIVAWIQAGPPDYQKMMLKFPPLCIVEAKIPLKIPGTELGTVVNVDSDAIYVVEGPSIIEECQDPKQVGVCLPDWVEVVGYWQGLTPERVAKIIRAKMEMP